LATLPVFAASAAETGPVNINSLWLRGFVLSTSAGAIISVGTAMIASPLLALLFGRDLAAAAPVLIIFSLIGFMFYLYTPLSQWLLLHDRQRVSLWINGVGMLVNIFAVFIFVPVWGLWGAVGAAFCTHATIAIIYYTVVLRHENFPNDGISLLALPRLVFATITAIIILYVEIGDPLICKLVSMGAFILFAYREIFVLFQHLISIGRGIYAQG